MASYSRGLLGSNVYLCLIYTALLWRLCVADDPFYSTKLTFAYKTVSPLGVPQQVIAVNDDFPGSLINVTTNYNVVVNVVNKLDEDLLVTWPGIQMRHDSWEDGVKDQIGSFFYAPSINFQRASGGFGPIIINNRVVIPIPFSPPYGDIILMIGDWYTQNHVALRRTLNGGKSLGMPDGVLINGKGPYQYNSTLVPDGIEHEIVNVEPGKTYRVRVHNVGISTSLNFRIQNHSLLLVETEGHYTVQQNYTNFDIHVGQSYSFLVTMDQDASSDYYIVASPRFVNESVWQRVTGVATLQYSNSKGKASGPLPDPPNDVYDKTWSLNQARSVRQNGTASGARPNPQGSFHYGSIDVTNTYVFQSLPPSVIDGSLRATLNGISFVNPKTPIRLADLNGVKADYKMDFPDRPLASRSHLDTSIINGTYKSFAEIIFQNNDTVMQTFHIDGYSFYVVGMDFGVWTPDSKNQYNKWDAISRCTVQVFPGGWAAVFVYLDNEGAWNIRTENLDRWYLGQETYIRVINLEDKTTEYAAPDNVRYCGVLQSKQKDKDSSMSVRRSPGIVCSMLILILAFIFISKVKSGLKQMATIVSGDKNTDKM
ncbi:hypothetical protein V2J09_001831 [Rumex salicifolius]